MAHLVIFVGSVAPSGAQVQISGEGFVSTGGDPVPWSALVDYNTEAGAMHQAIVDAAVAAAVAAGHSIPGAHIKTVFAGITSQ